MRFSPLALFLILIASAASSFSIDSYFTHAAVQDDGSLEVNESINFTLEQAYNEGFRTIRIADFGSLDNIVVHFVKVNGEGVPFAKQLNDEGQAEIVWKKTYGGKNDVELGYALKDRAQLYNDFAKVCFEHYGAGWSVPAGKFASVMSLPEAARGKDMHFEVYSSKEGTAQIDDLSVVIGMNDVPPGNYIGGCYLYDRGALHTANAVNASALAILNDEREAYGSKMLIEPEKTPSSIYCCLPAAVLSAILAAFMFVKDRRKPKYPENILPPDKEEPAFVSVLVRNKMPLADILAATILMLINRGCVDIVELEKKGETAAEVKREHTILLLKNRPEDLKPHEKAVFDMLFPQGKREADLDAMAAEYDKIKDKAGAKESAVGGAIESFSATVANILSEKKVADLKDTADTNNAAVIGMFMMGFIGSCIMLFIGIEFLTGYLAEGNTVEAAGIAAAVILVLPSAAYLVLRNRRVTVHEDLRDEYEKWDAFARAVKASRLKEYPPSSAVIWGGILVYASALGMADKVKRHMSELDAFTTKRMQSLDSVGIASRRYYTSAWGVYNLKKYGNRSGPESRSGGFSSHSSGGWSSGGGGGFSGGSSGGGGFR
jgi:uncharacterized membrane protein